MPWTAALACAAALGAAQARAEALDLKGVIAAHDQAVRSVHSLVAEIEVFLVAPDGRTQTNSRMTWYHQGDEDRLRLTAYDLMEPTKKTVLRDSANRADGFRTLQGYDPDSPPPLGPTVEQPGSGRITPRTAQLSMIGVDPRHYVLAAVLEEPFTYTLKQLCDEGSNVRLAHTPGAGGAYYEVQLEHNQKSYSVRIDPARNFAISRIERRGPPESTERYLTEASAWKDYGNGVYLPTEVKTEMILQGGPTIPSKITVGYRSVNETLPDGDLQVTFPDWVRVYEEPGGKVHIADGRGGYRHTFDSLKDYQAWRQDQLAPSDPPPATHSTVSRSPLVYAAAVSAVLLLACAGILLRRSPAKE